MPSREIKKDNQQIGELLKNARIQAGYSQQDVASALCLSRNHISELERGISAISAANLVKYCDLFNTTPNNLLGYSDVSIDVKLLNLLSDMSIEEQQKVIDIINIIKK